MAETPPTRSQVQTFGNFRIYHEDAAQIAPKKVEQAARQPMANANANANQVWRDIATQQPLLGPRDVRRGNLIIRNAAVSSKALEAGEVAHPMIQDSTVQVTAWTSAPQILAAEVAQWPHLKSRAALSTEWKERIQSSAKSVNDLIEVPADIEYNVKRILQQKTGFLARLMVKIHAFFHSIFSSYTKKYWIEDTLGLFKEKPQSDQVSASPSTDVQPPEPGSDILSSQPSPEHQLAQSEPAIAKISAQPLPSQEDFKEQVAKLRTLTSTAIQHKDALISARSELAKAMKKYIEAENMLEKIPSEKTWVEDHIKELFEIQSDFYLNDLSKTRTKAAVKRAASNLQIKDLSRLEKSQAQLVLSHAERMSLKSDTDFKKTAKKSLESFKYFVTVYESKSIRGKEKASETISFFSRKRQEVEKQASAFIELLELMPHEPEKFGAAIVKILSGETESFPESALQALKDEKVLQASNVPQQKQLQRALEICEQAFKGLLDQVKNYGITDCTGMEEAFNADISAWSRIIEEEKTDSNLTALKEKKAKASDRLNSTILELKAGISELIQLNKKAGRDLQPTSIRHYLQVEIPLLKRALTEVKLSTFIKAGLEALQ